MARNPIFYLVLLLVAATIISVQAGAYYYFQTFYSGANDGSTSSVSPSVPCNGVLPETIESVTVSTLINYGNGTNKWYNETGVPATWNFYEFTLFLAGCNVEAQYYGIPLNEHFVTGINGVRNNPPFYWTLWVYCQKDNAWSVSRVGADLIKMVGNPILAWYYQRLQSDNSYNRQPPVPETKTVVQCS